MDTNHIAGKATVKAGRRTKYSPKLIDKLLGYIEDGLNNSQACAACGIGVTTLREWRAEHEGLEERLEAAREVLRAKVLAKIKDAGAKDYKAWVEFLRLAFAEYRFGTSPQVNVAIQQNMAVSDPERAKLIAELEATRARALAAKSGASEPLQLTDASDSREIAPAAERHLKEERTVEVHVEPVRELIEERQAWREAARDEVDEILGD